MVDSAFSAGLPAGMDATDDTPVFVISVAAQLSGMHPQTLRQYDRLGLVSPGRASGRGRRYSARNVAQLLAVQRLSQDDGVNLAGIKRILELEDHIAALKARINELHDQLARAQTAVAHADARARATYRRDVVPTPTREVLVWRPGGADAAAPLRPT